MLPRLLVLALFASVVSATAARATTYTYDTLGRLSTVNYDNGTQVIYSYDAAGNRTSVVTQIGTNRPPQANNDTVGVALNTPLTFDPRVNDVDPDGDTLSITAVGSAGHGSTAFTSTSVTYTPATNYSGADGFTYTISDGQGHTASATVFATVGAPPAAVNDAIQTAQSTPVTFDPRTNDSDPSGYPLTITGVSTPAHGGAVVNAGTSVTYTPTSGYLGTDSFTYTISNGHGGTGIATDTVSIGVPPTAVADIVGIPLNTAVSYDPRINDTDFYNYPLSILATSTPSHGSVSIRPGGVGLIYTPTTGYSGPESFTYTIGNGTGLTGTATETLQVNPQPPVANNDATNIFRVTSVPYRPTKTFDPTTNDTDPNGQPVSIAAVTQPAHGSVTFSGNNVTYLYNLTVNASNPSAVLTDTFTYTITDVFGGTATATVSVNINVTYSP